MQRDPAVLAVIELEHREIDHPQRPPAVGDQLEIATDHQAQCAHEVAHRLVRTGAEEDQIAGGGAHRPAARGRLGGGGGALGLDHERLIYRHAGRDFRLTDVAGRVVREIMA